jgi:hypothetical protein
MNRNREIDKSISIDLQKPATPNNKYFCRWCNRKLFLKEQDKETGEHIWLCIYDNIEVIQDNELTKKATSFEIPKGSDQDMNKATYNCNGR